MRKMSTMSKPIMPATWVRRLSNAVEYRYNSDGNSSSYSSTEDNQHLDGQYIPSYMMNDDMSGRSYVDPWDMENYSFLRKQLEDISLSDKEISPAFESTHSDFYYVPLDNNGSPQYHHKHYVDVGIYKDGISPQSYRDDDHGLMANIDEYDFYNEHLDATVSLLHNELKPNIQPLRMPTAFRDMDTSRQDDSYLEFSNPSRQSERSRFNNQDYHTYTPPSIIKGISEIYVPNPVCKLRRRASVSFHPNLEMSDFIENDVLPSYHTKPREKIERNTKPWQENKKSLSDIKIKLNRRKSFHDVSNNPGLKFTCQERRKSVLDQPVLEKWQTIPTEVIPEYRTKGKIEKRRSIAEMSTEFTKKPQKSVKEGVLQNGENRESRVGLNVSFNNEYGLKRVPSKKKVSQPQSTSPLVYVYETARRRRKMFLPNTPPKIFTGDDYGYSHPELQDVFSLDPIEQYLNRPIGRYTMTNYGHLKIDYSCSWNHLDKCITQRMCM